MIRSLQTLALAAAVTFAVAPASAENWKLDEAHAAVIFKVGHMNGVSNQYGRFNDISGSLTTGDDASFDFTVQAASVDTNNAKRDDHLRGPDFFNVKQFPVITFTGDSITETESGLTLDGELMLHGVSLPLTAELTKVGEGKARSGGTLIGLETTFTINRSDFGMDKMVGPVGDEVTLTISFEAISE